MSDTQRASRPPEQTTADTPRLQAAAVCGLLGAAATVVSGAVVAAYVQPRSEVDDQQFSFPWSADALVPVSCTYAVFHLLVAIGILGLARSGLAGSGLAARTGLVLAGLGSVLLAVAEIASLSVRSSLMDDADASRVGMLFGVGTLLSVVAFLLLAVTTLRAGRWPEWGRWTPLGVALSSLLLIGLVSTPALAAGVGLFGLALTVMFAALVATTRSSRA